MTTGRINQITILIRGAPPGRTRRGDPLLEGAERYREGEHAGAYTQLQGTARADAGRRRATIRLPPLSSLRGGPRPGDRVFRPPR